MKIRSETIFLFSVGIGADRRGQHVGGQRDPHGIVGRHPQKRDEHGADHRRRAHARKACSNACSRTCDKAHKYFYQYIAHNVAPNFCLFMCLFYHIRIRNSIPQSKSRTRFYGYGLIYSVMQIGIYRSIRSLRSALKFPLQFLNQHS